MALTTSNPIALKSLAPNFVLPDTVSGNRYTLTDLKGEKGTVIMFICNHCPFVIHVNKELVQLANDYQALGINFIAISSNDVNYVQEDGPVFMKQVAIEHKYPFPYLYDETQQTAKDYNAACTPDFYIFNGKLELVYHGQLDDSRPNNGIPVTGSDMRMILDSMLKGLEISAVQKPSMGCGIKWK